MKISHYIFSGFIIVILLFATATYVNLELSDQVQENENHFARSTDVIRNTGRFQRNLLTMVNSLRGFILTSEVPFLDAYTSSKNENDSILIHLPALLNDDVQKNLFAEIVTLNNKWTAEFTKVLPSIQDSLQGSSNSIRLKNDGLERAVKNEKATHDDLISKFRQLTTYEYNLREQRRIRMAKSINEAKNISIALIIVSVIAAFVVISIVIKRISQRIQHMTKIADTIATGKYRSGLFYKYDDELTSLAKSLDIMAKNLSENIQLLQRSNKELEEFAHVVSHDMKAPLRGIGNVVSWIEEDHNNELPPKVKEYIEVIKGRISRAENLIEGLLAYARIGKETMEKETFAVTELITEIQENIINKSPVIIEMGSLPVLHTERLLLFQVFSNLISNAIKYNDKPRPLIKIFQKEQPESYEFFVEDNGIGIEKGYFARIFEVFQTLHDRDTVESTGIGLSIVKKILDSRHEKINVTSVPGQGSVFSFTWKK